MSQLSRPYQIALGTLIVLAIAWFTVLKPSDNADAVQPPLPGPPAAAAAVGPTGPQAPGVAGLGRAVDKAKGAVAASDASAAAAQTAASKASGDSAPAGATGTTGSSSKHAKTGSTGTSGAKAGVATSALPATVAQAKSKPEADPSAPILREVAAGEVAVVLFSSRDASDDRAVRRALVGTDRHGGMVTVHPISINDVADYTAITAGIEVSQAPTILVIGKGNRARRLVGFTDTRGIDQLVSDVGGEQFAARRITSYRGKIENICTVYEQSLKGNGLSGADVEGSLANLRDDFVDSGLAAGRLEAPRRYRTFHKLLRADIALNVRILGDAQKAQDSGADPRAVFSSYASRIARVDRAAQAAAKRAGISKLC